jgi:hypothetical protein
MESSGSGGDTVWAMSGTSSFPGRSGGPPTRTSREIRRPVFISLPTPLAEACRYVSFDRLEQEVEELGDRTQHLQASFLDVLAEEASRALSSQVREVSLFAPKRYSDSPAASRASLIDSWVSPSGAARSNVSELPPRPDPRCLGAC